MLKIIFKPKGVCSREMRLTIDDKGFIQDAAIIGGCDGNSQGICSLITGQHAKEIADRLRGIKCGFKSTSCPDQLSKAIDKALSE